MSYAYPGLAQCLFTVLHRLSLPEARLLRLEFSKTNQTSRRLYNFSAHPQGLNAAGTRYGKTTIPNIWQDAI